MLVQPYIPDFIHYSNPFEWTQNGTNATVESAISTACQSESLYGLSFSQWKETHKNVTEQVKNLSTTFEHFYANEGVSRNDFFASLKGNLSIKLTPNVTNALKQVEKDLLNPKNPFLKEGTTLRRGSNTGCKPRLLAWIYNIRTSILFPSLYFFAAQFDYEKERVQLLTNVNSINQEEKKCPSSFSMLYLIPLVPFLLSLGAGFICLISKRTQRKNEPIYEDVPLKDAVKTDFLASDDIES